MNIHELAWSAGFFDGEGSTTLAKGEGKGGPFLHLSVTQCGKYAKHQLIRLQKALQGIGQIYGPYQRANRKEEYYWKATSFEHAQAAVAMLWRFLGPQKREQAKEALAVMRNKQDSPNMTPEARSARARHARQCQLDLP